MPIHLLLPAPLVALSLLLAACGDDEPRAGGATAPAPAPTIATVSPAPSATETPAPEPAEAQDPLAGLDPCGLLSGADRRSIGLTGGDAKTLGDATVCRYRYEGATLSDSYTVSVELFHGRRLEDVIGDRIRPPRKLGSHRAAVFVDAAGICLVGVAVGPSRVDLTAVGGERPHACRLAQQVARAVEPELP